jgi:hypothetical protein
MNDPAVTAMRIVHTEEVTMRSDELVASVRLSSMVCEAPDPG